jgi:hypothetical protein
LGRAEEHSGSHHYLNINNNLRRAVDGLGLSTSLGKSRDRRVEFQRWSESSSTLNMCSCEGPPDSILQFLDSACEVVPIYQSRQLPNEINEGVALGSRNRTEIFVKAFCTEMGKDVSVHLFQDHNCTKRILKFSSTWNGHPKPSACGSSKTFNNYFGSPVPSCANMFRCIGYGNEDAPP